MSPRWASSHIHQLSNLAISRLWTTQKWVSAEEVSTLLLSRSCRQSLQFVGGIGVNFSSCCTSFSIQCSFFFKKKVSPIAVCNVQKGLCFIHFVSFGLRIGGTLTRNNLSKMANESHSTELGATYQTVGKERDEHIYSHTSVNICGESSHTRVNIHGRSQVSSLLALYSLLSVCTEPKLYHVCSKLNCKFRLVDRATS